MLDERKLMADCVKNASEPPPELEPPFWREDTIDSAISCASAKVWMYSFLNGFTLLDFSTSFRLIT